jgi:hypothetical protein
VNAAQDLKLPAREQFSDAETHCTASSAGPRQQWNEV